MLLRQTYRVWHKPDCTVLSLYRICTVKKPLISCTAIQADCMMRDGFGDPVAARNPAPRFRYGRRFGGRRFSLQGMRMQSRPCRIASPGGSGQTACPSLAPGRCRRILPHVSANRNGACPRQASGCTAGRQRYGGARRDRATGTIICAAPQYEGRVIYGWPNRRYANLRARIPFCMCVDTGLSGGPVPGTVPGTVPGSARPALRSGYGRGYGLIRTCRVGGMRAGLRRVAHIPCNPQTARSTMCLVRNHSCTGIVCARSHTTFQETIRAPYAGGVDPAGMQPHKVNDRNYACV